MNTYDRLITELNEMTGGTSEPPITDTTEIYYDLGIYGHDLYDLFVWINTTFDVRVRINLLEYAPSERPFQWLFRKRRQLRERRLRTYKSLTVADVLHAIEKRGWLFE